MHNHDHHSHTHNSSADSREETLALLNYMVKHNRQHADELHELAHGVENEAVRDALHQAVELLRAGSDKLAEALELWKEE